MTSTELAEDRRSALLECQRRILERIASGAPLAESLGTLVRLIEEQTPDMRCAVLLAGAEQRSLSFAAAPNIPEDYKLGIEPFLTIAPDMGSCGTAAYLRAPVYTEDTATDPRWEGCRHFAVRNGLRAIWSTPILGDDNAVLGTFAMYYGEPRLPSPEHIQLIDMATAMARVAIQAKQDEERLRASEERFRLIAENACDLIQLVDTDARRLYTSPSYKALYGCEVEELLGTSSFTSVYAEDRPRIEEQFSEMVRTGVGRRFDVRVISRSGELRTVQAEATPIKDASGRVISVLGVGRDVTEERATREALRESEARFRQIAENIREVFWMSTPGMDEVLYVSPAYEEVWGRSLESLRRNPRSFLDAILPEDRSAVIDVIKGERQSSFDVLYRIMRPDGSMRWIRDRGFPVRNEAGEVYRIVGVAEDVSDRKHAEEHLRLVINTIPTTTWSVRPDGVVDFVNQRYLEYTGLSFEEAIAEPTRTMHPEELPDVMEKWSAAMAAGQGYEGEMRLRRADGEYRWFLVRTVPLRDAQGNIVKWYGASIDIQDRKRIADALRESEQALRRSEDRLRVVIDTIPTMAWSLLPDGAVDFVNQRWLEYSGLSLDEALAEASRIVHPADLPSAVHKWSLARVAGQPHEAEMRLRRADGEYRWFLVRVVPLRNEYGAIVKWYGTSTDIEDRKRAEQVSRQAAEELQALSRRLVELQESERKALARELHDRLGETLTALSINLAMLKQAVQGDAQAATRIDDSAALVNATAASIEDLVAELRPPMLDDHGLAAAIEWYARQFTRRTGVAVHVQADEPGKRLAAEVEMALFRIAQEALTNVAKHARAEHVSITLWSSHSELVMSIADDGIGLPRAAPASERHGLGLVTMRERAQAVGGAFKVEPLADGEGTRLTVKLAL